MILSNFVFYSGYDFRYCLKKQNKTKKTLIFVNLIFCVFLFCLAMWSTLKLYFDKCYINKDYLLLLLVGETLYPVTVNVVFFALNIDILYSICHITNMHINIQFVYFFLKSRVCCLAFIKIISALYSSPMCAYLPYRQQKSMLNNRRKNIEILCKLFTVIKQKEDLGVFIEFLHMMVQPKKFINIFCIVSYNCIK